MPQNNTSNNSSLRATSAGLIVESLFFGVLSLIILAGNTLVCTAIYKNRKLRTKTNYYLVSLAVADIMVGGFSVPYWVYIILGMKNYTSVKEIEIRYIKPCISNEQGY